MALGGSPSDMCPSRDTHVLDRVDARFPCSDMAYVPTKRGTTTVPADRFDRFRIAEDGQHRRAYKAVDIPNN